MPASAGMTNYDTVSKEGEFLPFREGRRGLIFDVHTIMDRLVRTRAMASFLDPWTAKTVGSVKNRREANDMTTLGDLKGYGRELEGLLQLRTAPIAIRLLERVEDIPEGAIRPKRDLGSHLALCQGFAMSRRDKATVAMLKEDHWCYLPVIAFGLAEPPEFFMEGNTFLKHSVADLKSAKDLANTFPRLECGKYVGVVSSPLRLANFEPDLVVTYCNSNQLRCLLMGMKYKEGYLVTSRLDPGGACLRCTVPVIQTGECQVTVPCGGDRSHALARDDEMIFSVPRSKLEDLILGLRYFDGLGRGYVRYAPDMRPEYPLSDPYVKVGRMIGMEVDT